jgi:hypothetical protein
MCPTHGSRRARSESKETVAQLKAKNEELRRERFDVDRNTVRRALRSAEPPRYEPPPPPAKLDPFRDEILISPLSAGTSSRIRTGTPA